MAIANPATDVRLKITIGGSCGSPVVSHSTTSIATIPSAIDAPLTMTIADSRCPTASRR